MNRSDVEALIKTAQDRRRVKLPNGFAVSASINLANADLGGADLSGLNLSRCNLWKANLKKANLSGTKLKQANLAGAILDGVKTDAATTFESANLREASYKSCPHLETLDEFETRKGAKAAIIAKAFDQAQATKDWDAIPVEKKYDCRVRSIGGTKYVVGDVLKQANLDKMRI